MKVSTINCQRTIGWLLAFFFMVGKWSPSRLITDSEGGGLFFLEMRFVSLVGILILTGWMEGQHQRKRVTKLPRPRIKLLSFLTYSFLIWAMFSAAWAPDIDLALPKVFDVLLLFLLVVALQINLGRDKANELLFGFWTGMLGIGFVMAALALTTGGGGSSGSQADRVTVLGGGPIILGRNMGLMIFAAFYLQSRVNIRWVNVKPGLMFIAVMGAIVLLLTGSRGALLSTVAAGAVYFVLERTSWSKKVVIAFAVFVASLMFLSNTGVGQDVQAMFKKRIIELTFEEKYASGREDLWYEALEMTKENPLFGAGLSGFEAEGITKKDSVLKYPHNIFLEVLCETGIVGFLLFLSAGVAGIDTLRRNWRFISIVSVAALVLNFILAQSSGQIFDSRGLAIFLYLSLIPIRK